MTFKEGKVIDKLAARKREIIIRYPKKSDTPAIWKFYNKVMGETDFLSRFTPVTMKDERKWLVNAIVKMKKKKSVYIVAEHGGRIVGSCDINLPEMETKKHIGVYGISILQEYSGMGLGTTMSRHLIDIARKEMKTEIVTLDVYSKNKIAQGLYRKLGFRYVGKIPRGVKRKGKYMDDILMYKVLKK